MEGDFSGEFLNREQQDPVEQFFSSEQRGVEKSGLLSSALLAVSESVEQAPTFWDKLRKEILGGMGLAIAFAVSH